MQTQLYEGGGGEGGGAMAGEQTRIKLLTKKMHTKEIIGISY